MKKYLYHIIQLIILSFSSSSFLISQYLNQETGWTYYQSSNQSFYIFEEIQIDGMIAVGDGWAPTLSEQSVCYENPNTCDVIGAFVDDVCVGWVYADQNGGTTLPLMGVDNTNEIVQNLTQEYCQEGDQPEIKIYDATYGTILDMSSSTNLPDWENNFAHVIFNISFANNGIINPESLWFYYQSSEQAFYLFENIFINDFLAESNDIIGAFKDDVCVGWINYNPGGYTAVPVMGAETDNFEYYMNDDEIPDFKIYDYSENNVLNLTPSEEVPTWLSNGYYFINGNSQSAVYGCTDSFAENYNFEADEACIDCCIYLQQIDLSSGWNMISFNIIPVEDALFDVLNQIELNLQLVLDEAGSAIFPDELGQDWTDNIGSWSNTEGYLVKVSENSQINLENNERIFLPIDIPLTAGWNIISYPAQLTQNIESVLESIIFNGNLFSVFDEGGNVYIPGVINSINSLNPGEAYYVKVNSDDILPINEGDVVFDDMIVDVPLYRTEHFEPIWTGNPFSPMTFFIDQAMWNQVNLVEGDEIGIFDGENCVGATVVPPGGFQSESGFQIVTSKDDGSGNGYTEGNEIAFRVWRESISVDMDITIDVFTDELGSVMSPYFEALRAPFVELNAYPPSLVQNFITTGQDQQVELTWNMPSVGNYQVYNYPDPGSSNAITFSIYRDNNLQTIGLNMTSFIDIDLDNNSNYSYDIFSVNPVGSSSSNNDSAITLPGIPVISVSAFENAISLTWSDPVVTGDANPITYNVERQWAVGDSTYAQQIANLIDEQVLLDQSLLNSTEYSYRVQSVNSTGSSFWSEESTESTLNSSLSEFINNVSGQVAQIVQPPDNIVELFWDFYDGALYYRVYEQNILIADNVFDVSYIDQGRDLQTSTIYRYVVTAMTASGETSPSSLLEIETLPELPPDSPSGMSVASSQNSFDLSWNNVPGYGNPIGGAAAQYNIYRYDLDDVQSGVLIGTNTGLNNTAYSDNNIDDNITYCYGVTGVNSEDNEGGVSEIVCATTPTQLAASVPQNLQASSGRTNVDLSWSASSGSPTINYQVYRDGEFVVNTTSTSYSDTNLASSTEYVYYVVAWNELGPSSPSDSVSSTTSGQTHLLSSEVPEDISVQISESARASNYIDGYAEITWDAKEYDSYPFELSYSGNPYSPHTIVINNVESFEAGDVVGIFDRDEQLCIGIIVAGEGTWPQMSASKDDGSGNGFIEGHDAYFKVWRSATGHVHTITESPSFTFSGLGLNYVDLTIHDELHKVFRNGEIIASNIQSEFYLDTNLETGMSYNYYVSAQNVLGSWTQSNPSDVAMVNTLDGEEYAHNAPVLSSIQNHVTTEDQAIGIFLEAFDEDGDELIYFAEPVDPNSPVVCDIDGSTLTLTPAPDFYDEDGFDIAVTVYDDYSFYETNTLTAEDVFEFTILSENDAPVVINPLQNMQIVQGDFEEYLSIDIANVFVDADIIVMNEDNLIYEVSNSNNNVVDTYIDNDSLYIQYLSSGFSDIYISANDQYDVFAYDTLTIYVDEVLSADDFVWPEDFKIGDVYPNPFNPTANFNIDVPFYSKVEINIYNIEGKLISNLFDGSLSKGVYKMTWNANGFGSGVYLISMKTESGVQTKKTILLK